MTVSLERWLWKAAVLDAHWRMPGNSLKQASVVLVRVVWWGVECWLYKPHLISIISPFTSQFTESLSDAPCQGCWFLGEEHCPRGSCGLWWLHGGASSLTSTVKCVCFCPQAAAIIPFFQVLDLVGSQPGYTVQERTGVNCFCCYRWAGWEEIKTLLRGGSWNSSAIRLHQEQTSGPC